MRAMWVRYTRRRWVISPLLRQEFPAVAIGGGVFVVEISVILQVGSSAARRIFLHTIHHHHELKGYGNCALSCTFGLFHYVGADWPGDVEGTLIAADYCKKSSLLGWVRPSAMRGIFHGSQCTPVMEPALRWRG